MSAHDEMQAYLEELLEHERGCEVENCEICQCAQNIYRLARNQIFSEVAYPGITIAARSRMMEAQKPASDTGTVSIRRAA